MRVSVGVITQEYRDGQFRWLDEPYVSVRASTDRGKGLESTDADRPLCEVLDDVCETPVGRRMLIEALLRWERRTGWPEHPPDESG